MAKIKTTLCKLTLFRGVSARSSFYDQWSHRRLQICRGNQHNFHKKQNQKHENIAHLQTSRRTPFSLSCDISFAGDATLRNLKVWTVLHPLNIAVTTCTHLPTNRHTCSQRSQWRRAIVLARKTRLSTIERGHQVDG